MQSVIDQIKEEFTYVDYTKPQKITTKIGTLIVESAQIALKRARDDYLGKSVQLPERRKESL